VGYRLQDHVVNAAQARKLQAASEHVMKAQDEALSIFRSLMTLSDKVSGTSPHTGS